MDANGVAMVGLAVVQFLNRLFEQLNVIHKPILALWKP
jgi:hypothetical protein